ncbi:outer membrane protein assembly factor BamE [Sagittula sp. NFXS13]|uniref:Outer membrane protein assembly factor BamE (Lipoprotein component of BamABCDE complex) n=1 Tax=Sagittula marina TaxID=943940 RepID=A0A7W6DRT7_9RHOB|nr:outer membrane protein assembly factor BamE [Sagittula marina]MBB3987639.1 outer membrane protein assembly factor BamE (lipoprotein component of BamABCDE complex) [Sagittula marina]
MIGMKTTLKYTLVAVACVGLAGCETSYRNHGYVPPEEDLQQIVPGIDTRATVEDVIGVPNASGVLNNSGYYYIQSEVKHFAWQKPTVTDRQIVAITFDPAGVVENIESYGLDDGKVVPLSRRVTRTSDGDISFIRKLFGNIGGLNVGQLLGE